MSFSVVDVVPEHAGEGARAPEHSTDIPAEKECEREPDNRTMGQIFMVDVGMPFDYLDEWYY